MAFFHAPYQPSGHVSQQQVPTSAVSPTTTTSDPKRPFGGLVPSQPKGTRAYQDAASYNQHLAQHQAYTAQAQAATQAANNVFRNPYITTQLQSQSSSSTYPAPAADSGNTYSQPPQPQHSQYATSTQSQRGLFGTGFIYAHMPFYRTKQCQRAATAVL
jgi:dual specificity protein kinase YAK1